MQRALCLIAAVALAGSGSGQESRPDWAATLRELRSDQPAQQACGAWHAVQGRLVQAGPELVRLLGLLAADDAGDNRFVLRSVLDAVAELRPRIPPEALAPWLVRGRVETAALVCALRAPGAHAAPLITLLTPPIDDSLWIPITGALLDHDPHSVLPHVLEQARTRVLITVRDPGSGGGATSFTTGIGCGSMTAPPGFPPTVLYRIEFEDRGGTPLLTRPTPVWVRREVHTEPSFGVGGTTSLSSGGLDRAGHALGCLQQLADLPATLRLPSSRKIDVAWSSAHSYRSAVENELAPLRAHWQQTLRALVGRRLLASGQLQLPPPFQIEVKDLRQDRGTPLPEIDGTGRVPASRPAR